MTTLIAGLIGVALLTLFMGYYVVLLPFPPLVVILVGVLVMAIVDFVTTYREERKQDGDRAGRS